MYAVKIFQKMRENLRLAYLFLLILSAASGNDPILMDALHSKAAAYYSQGDYSNAIIVYEDLLAEQELAFGNQDIHVAETLTQLGEMYALTGMPDIAEYYFQQAIIIFQESFESGKNALEVPLLNLLKIYIFQNDTLMTQTIKHQLHSIAAIFQTPNSIYPDFPFAQDTLTFPKEDRAFDLMNLGLSYLDHGLYSEAAIQFNEALDNQTENLDFHFFRDFFPQDSILTQNMINAFSFQLPHDSTGASYFFLALFSKSGDDAYEHIRNYIHHRPSDLRGHLLYSELLFNNNEWFDALFQFQKALWLDSNNIDAQFGVGLCLYHLQEFNDAVSAFRKALKIDSYNHSAYYFLGRSLMAEDNFREAIPNLTQSLLLDPDNSDTYFNLGKSYFETGKIIQAREAFNRTIRIEPQYGSAYYHIGLINEDIMEIEKAVHAYTRAREYSPEIEDVHYRLGMLLFRTGELKQAMEPLRQFIIYQPDSLQVLEAMGEIFISENRFPEAIDTYNRIQTIYPEKLEINLALAESFYQLKNYESAIEVYKNILLFDDENFEVMIKMGSIYNESGEYKNAENIFHEAINCTTPTMKMYYQLALTYGNQGNYMSAILAFQ